MTNPSVEGLASTVLAALVYVAISEHREAHLHYYNLQRLMAAVFASELDICSHRRHHLRGAELQVYAIYMWEVELNSILFTLTTVGECVLEIMVKYEIIRRTKRSSSQV